MDIGAFSAEDIANDVHVRVICELKKIGVKYRKEKKTKVVEDNTCTRRIFRTPLHLLELSDVILANGSVVQIPKLVADACNRILERVEMEGIFRKAGSSRRQKEIRIILESGMPLGKSHHVIDIANVVKYFFRELPEPLIPNSMQDTLLHALLIGENQDRAILLACLLLPNLTINTLRFFMQFLHTVSLSEAANKMSIENLAIIFTPGIMPFANINSHRFTNHIKVVQLLIENANYIGEIPKNIISKLRMNETPYLSNVTVGPQSSAKSSLALDRLETNAKKKKNQRRSGSLTQMFNGLKKMVGSAIGSSEELDIEDSTSQSSVMAVESRRFKWDNITKIHNDKLSKRKFTEPSSGAFSAKKKRELLALLPNNGGGFLPNTPITKGNKKHRPSLSGNKTANLLASSMERRWSIVGSGWSKNKNKHEKHQHFRSGDSIFNCDFETIKSTNNGINRRKNKCASKNVKQPCDQNRIQGNTRITEAKTIDKLENQQEEQIKEDAVVVKNISHGFGNQNCPPQTVVNLPDLKESSFNILHSFESIQTQYERMLTETAYLSLHKTEEEFPRNFACDLNIRCRSYQPHMRSPSARKIGSIRRRPQDRDGLRHTENKTVANEKITRFKSPSSTEYLNRTRQTIMSNCTPKKQNKIETGFKINFSNVEWMAGEYFFRDIASRNEVIDDEYEAPTIKHVDHVMTPINDRTKLCITNKSMSSPETLLRSVVSIHALKAASTSKIPFGNRISMSGAMDDDVCGRASISRLRTLNAGMVMAKAKLFDRLGDCNNEDPSEINDWGELPTNVHSADSSNKRCQISNATLSEERIAPKAVHDMFIAHRKPSFINMTAIKQDQSKSSVAAKRQQRISYL